MSTPAAQILASLRLEAHAALFEAEGLDDIETIVALNRLDPAYWDVLAAPPHHFKRGHRLKLLSKLAQLGFT